MPFSNIKKDNKHLQFKITDVDLSIVNSIRRIILSEIPSIALNFDPVSDNNHDITIHNNHSALHNEYLSHRLSLLPMCFPEDIVDGDFNQNDYVFKLKVKNTTTNTITVNSHDIKIFNSKGKLYPQEFHEQIFPKDPFTKSYIIITKLRPNIYNPDMGEEIDIEFKGSKNVAKLHARWATVCCCAFSNTIDETAAKAALEDIMKSAENKQAAINKFNTLDKYRHFMKNKYGEANTFDFQLESECGLSTTFIFFKAICVLKDKFINLNKMLHDGEIPIKRIHDSQYLYDVVISNEDYTLLNSMHSLIYNNEIRENKNTILEYIGYYQPHPLDTKMVLKIKIKDDTPLTEFLVSCNKQIIKHLETIEQKWLEVSK